MLKAYHEPAFKNNFLFYVLIACFFKTILKNNYINMLKIF